MVRSARSGRILALLALAGCTATTSSAAVPPPTQQMVVSTTVTSSSTTSTTSTTSTSTTSTSTSTTSTTSTTNASTSSTTVPPLAAVPVELIDGEVVVGDDPAVSMTMRLPASQHHPEIGDVARSWAAVQSAQFVDRARAVIRERERLEAERLAAIEAAAAAAASTTVPEGTSATTATTTTTTTVPAPPPPPELVVSYELADQRAGWSVVRMVATVVLDGPPETSTAAFYVSDWGDIVGSRGVLAPERSVEVTALVAGLLGERARDWSYVPNESILTDVTLAADGALVVRVPTRHLVEGADPTPVVIGADAVGPLLGPIGRAVRAGEPLTRDPVDCAVSACVALTFDDGPGTTTEVVLDMFRRNGEVATFFVLGPNVERRPELTRRIVGEGHEIGNHAWSHRSLPGLSDEDVLDELEGTDAAIAASTGVTPTLMRPPYGHYDLAVRYLGYPLALWDVDTRDWQHRDPSETVRRALQAVRPGSVVVMHDIHASTVDAVPLLVAELRASGYRLVTMSTLTGPAEPGAVYFSQSNVEGPPPPTTTTTTTTTTTPVPPG